MIIVIFIHFMDAVYISNVTVTRKGYSWIIEWVPLEIDTKIWYQIEIKNVTDENNTVRLAYSSSYNITATNCTIMSGPCDQLIVTIIPFSDAGRGNSSHVKINRECGLLSFKVFT